MSDQTFEQLWRRMLVYYPELPIPLAQEFINSAYSQAISRNEWSGLRKYGGFDLDAPVTISVTVTSGSTTVTGTGIGSHVGKEMVVGGIAPFYTIVTQTNANSVEIDRAYIGDNATADAVIQNIFLTVPSDFLSFISVADLINNWRLHHYFTQEELDRIDAKRNRTGTPFLLAGATPHPTSKLPRFELYPRTGIARNYPYLYTQRPPLLSAASDRPIFPIRGDVLRHGALAELALWPGTKQLKNPYFDMQQHAIHFQRFKEELVVCEKDDQNLVQTMIGYWGNLPWAPFDAEFIQAHGGWPFIP